MNVWAFVLGLATLVGMWLLSRNSWRPAGSASSGGTADDAEEPRRYGLSGIEVAAVIAVIGILAAIALPSYQNYAVKSRASEHVASLAQMRITLAETLASAETPQAKHHLERANDDLVKASEYLRRTAGKEIRTEFVTKLVTSAAFEVEEAGVAEPGLREAHRTAALAQEIRELEAALATSQATPAEHETPPSRIWSIVFLGLLSLCVVAFLAAYFLLLVRHWNSRPGAVIGHLRARLEPLFAFFAFILGIALVLIPELDQAIAMWGAGISGSGVGYWLKTVGSPVGTA